MSSEPISIRAEHLTKSYHIYDRPQNRLKQFFLPRLQRILGLTPRQYFREFRALDDVSLEIRRGETVGIVGRNGSGKSTLLQLIAGTLNPSSGSATVTGRVAALLELGSGFNPEFTGRENVYLNAIILGLSRAEIDARFLEIEAFADIGEFIDQPVKKYSSGMYVRLAFAVIAHVDADILIVDEALSVGDAVFTQKCMRFIREFQKRGTLLFVSHDTASVQNLCNSAIWLSAGKVALAGASRDVTDAYLQDTFQQLAGQQVILSTITGPSSEKVGDAAKLTPAGTPVIDYSARATVYSNLATAKGWQTGVAELLEVILEAVDGQPRATYAGGERVRLTIRARTHERLERPILGFLFKDRLGQDLFGENTLAFTGLQPVAIPPGERFQAHFTFTLPMLPNGQYAVMASVADGTLHDHVQHHWLHDALIVTVTSSHVRWGLVGVAFENVALSLEDAEQDSA